MIALKCPGCAADITVDDSREFGFCTYCGTKILLRRTQKIIHSFEDTINAELEIVKRLIDAQLWVDAQNKLKSILRNYPDNTDALLYLAFVESMNDIHLGYNYTYLSSKEKAKDYYYNRYDNSIGVNKTKHLAGTVMPSLYFELKKCYQNKVEDFFRTIDINTAQFIQKVQTNHLLLDGYFYDEESDGHDVAFFTHNGRLKLYDSGLYYDVNSISAGMINLSFEMFESQMYLRQPKKQLKIDAFDGKLLLIPGIGVCCKRDTSRYESFYTDKNNKRKSGFVCKICGGESGILGCKKRCRQYLT